MNKYQEVLDKIKTMGDKDLYNERHLEWANTLQELVDKATPKKVNIGQDDYSSLSKGVYDKCCPCCEELLGFTDQNIIIPYCPFCGQKLDWSDENESR